MLKFSFVVALVLSLGSCSRALSDYGYPLPESHQPWSPSGQMISLCNPNSQGGFATYQHDSYTAPEIKINKEELAKELMRQRVSFLKKFYAKLSSAKFDKARFNKKYGQSLSEEMAQALQHYAAGQGERRGEWAMFMKRDFANHTDFCVDYQQNNWYSVGTDGSNVVYVKVEMKDFFSKPMITDFSMTPVEWNQRILGMR